MVDGCLPGRGGVVHGGVVGDLPRVSSPVGH